MGSWDTLIGPSQSGKTYASVSSKPRHAIAGRGCAGFPMFGAPLLSHNIFELFADTSHFMPGSPGKLIAPSLGCTRPVWDSKNDPTKLCELWDCGFEFVLFVRLCLRWQAMDFFLITHVLFVV